MIAHQGASCDAPANTLEAFELAIGQGAEYVEFDVRAAADGTLIVAHDAVREPRPAHVPTLDATLEALRGRVGLAVEIKEARVTEATLAALTAHGVEPEETMILSFRIRALEQVRRVHPELRLVLHLGLRPDPLAAARFWGVGFEDGAARPRLLARAHSHGLATTVYTVNEPARMLTLADLGVTGIFSDRPGLLRQTLGDPSERS